MNNLEGALEGTRPEYEIYTAPRQRSNQVSSVLSYFAGVFLLIAFGAVVGFYAGVKTVESMTDSIAEKSLQLEVTQ